MYHTSIPDSPQVDWVKANICIPFSSVAQSFPTLCDPMNRSTPGLPVHHKLLEFTQTHVHQVGDAIQPSHPLFPLLLLPPITPSIRVFSMSQLFAWGGQSTGVSALASFLPKKSQVWSPSEWTECPKLKIPNLMGFVCVCVFSCK